MTLFSLLGAESTNIYSFEDYKNGPEHRRLSERLRKTLYYGKSPTTERPSFPMTQIAVEFFQDAAPKEFGLIDESYASFSSRRACMSPCSLMLAMLYIKRLKHGNPEYLKQISSSDLFLISVMMASKYLYDEGVDEEVFNDEWSESAKIDIDELGQLERGFLSAIDWRLFVRPCEFQNLLKMMEKRIAMNEGLERGWFSYTDLLVLTEDLNWASLCYELCHEIWKVMVTCSVAYVASVITILGSTAFVLSMRNLLTLTITQAIIRVPLPVHVNGDLHSGEPQHNHITDILSLTDDSLDNEVSQRNINFLPWLKNFEFVPSYGHERIVCSCKRLSRKRICHTSYFDGNIPHQCIHQFESKRNDTDTVLDLKLAACDSPEMMKSSCWISLNGQSESQTVFHLLTIPTG